MVFWNSNKYLIQLTLINTFHRVSSLPRVWTTHYQQKAFSSTVVNWLPVCREIRLVCRILANDLSLSLSLSRLAQQSVQIKCGHNHHGLIFSECSFTKQCRINWSSSDRWSWPTRYFTQCHLDTHCDDSSCRSKQHHLEWTHRLAYRWWDRHHHYGHSTESCRTTHDRRYQRCSNHGDLGQFSGLHARGHSQYLSQRSNFPCGRCSRSSDTQRASDQPQSRIGTLRISNPGHWLLRQRLESRCKRVVNHLLQRLRSIVQHSIHWLRSVRRCCRWRQTRRYPLVQPRSLEFFSTNLHRFMFVRRWLLFRVSRVDWPSSQSRRDLCFVVSVFGIRTEFPLQTTWSTIPTNPLWSWQEWTTSSRKI